MCRRGERVDGLNGDLGDNISTIVIGNRGTTNARFWVADGMHASGWGRDVDNKLSGNVQN